MDPRYATAAQAAAMNNANVGGSPNGNSADIQNLQNLAQIQFRAGAAGMAAGALGGNAKNQASIDAAALSAAQQEDDLRYKAALKAEQEKLDREKALSDPKNYQKVASDDGGWNFFKPDGTPISASQYAAARGEQLTSVLDGSNNAADKQFVKDYRNILTIGRALHGSDEDVKALQETDDEDLKKYIQDTKGLTFAQQVGAFKEHYGNVFKNSNALNSVIAGQDTARREVASQGLSSSLGSFLDNLMTDRRQKGALYR